MTPGIHLVHKPSADEFLGGRIAARRRAREKMCHGGALDPFASGLLLVLVEPATKLFNYLHDVPKTYDATVRWGVETDNGDPTGTPIFVNDSFKLTSPQLDAELEKRIGWHDQTPPATSNKRVGGERAYAKAHRGEPVELVPQIVYMHAAQWLRHDFVSRESQMRMSCAAGTTCARSCATWTLTRLRRTPDDAPPHVDRPMERPRPGRPR
jgi:tRNA pseudouridine55 synthase